ncbi:hypothetical protein PG993_002311 [Apiospora rasikravindrae]|uniref:Uncharacterized protein n=1 Tax=Apiospora rasikravindrae TaxID=990691 RepID=A0ABR1TW93_9PEZI
MAEQRAAYWPEGWDRERLLNSSATGELEYLLSEEVRTIREGLIADFGEPAFQDLMAEMGRRKAAAAAAEPAASTAVSAPEPPFMETMRLHEERTGRQWDPWGFIIGNDSDWGACKQQFARILDESLVAYRGFPGLEECMEKMKIQWIEDIGIEDASVASIARIALHDKTMTSGEMELFTSCPDPGMNHSLCLYITPSSIHSVLNTTLPVSTLPRRQRKEIPFVVAVSAYAATTSVQGPVEEEEDGWQGFFNVAVETLLTSLFPIIADDTLSPREIGSHVKGEDVWCDSTRWGLHKAGVGYWDQRTKQAV